MLLGIGSVSTVPFFSGDLGCVGPMWRVHSHPWKSERGSGGTGSIPQSLAQCASVARFLPQGQPNIQIKGAQKERRHRPNSIQENCHGCSAQFILPRKQQQRRRKKKKTLRSGSGIRNKSAKAEGIPNGKEARFPRLIRVLWVCFYFQMYYCQGTT